MGTRISWSSDFKKSVCLRLRSKAKLTRDLRSQALLISQGSVRAEEWEAAIRKALKDKADEYEKASERALNPEVLLTADRYDSIRGSRYYCVHKAIDSGSRNEGRDE